MRVRRHPAIMWNWERAAKRVYRELRRARAGYRRGLPDIRARREYDKVIMEDARAIAARGKRYWKTWLKINGSR